MIWQSNAPYKFRYKVNVNFPNIQLFHHPNTKKVHFLSSTSKTIHCTKSKKDPTSLKESGLLVSRRLQCIQ